MRYTVDGGERVVAVVGDINLVGVGIDLSIGRGRTHTLAWWC